MISATKKENNRKLNHLKLANFIYILNIKLAIVESELSHPLSLTFLTPTVALFDQTYM